MKDQRKAEAIAIERVQAALNGQVDAIIGDEIWAKVLKVYNPDKISILLHLWAAPSLWALSLAKAIKNCWIRLTLF